MDTGPIFANIGTFVALSTYALMETHIKWVPRNSSDKDAVCRVIISGRSLQNSNKQPHITMGEMLVSGVPMERYG